MACVLSAETEYRAGGLRAPLLPLQRPTLRGECGGFLTSSGRGPPSPGFAQRDSYLVIDCILIRHANGQVSPNRTTLTICTFAKHRFQVPQSGRDQGPQNPPPRDSEGTKRPNPSVRPECPDSTTNARTRTSGGVKGSGGDLVSIGELGWGRGK